MYARSKSKLNTGIVNHGSSSRVQGPAEEVSVEKTNETLFQCIKVAVGAALIVAGEGIPLLINIGLEVANQRLGGKGWGESFCVGVQRAHNAPYDVGNFVGILWILQGYSEFAQVTVIYLH